MREEYYQKVHYFYFYKNFPLLKLSIIKRIEITWVLLHCIDTVPSTSSCCNTTFNVESIGIYLYTNTVWLSGLPVLYHSQLFFPKVKCESLVKNNLTMPSLCKIFYRPEQMCSLNLKWCQLQNRYFCLAYFLEWFF